MVTMGSGVAIFQLGTLSAVAEPLLLLVASEKYRAGAAIIPWVIGGVALQGLFPVASAGLQIRGHKDEP